MALTLEDWDRLVGRHLHMIEAGADIIERHASQLFALPRWETKAEDKLEFTEQLLTDALGRVRDARATLEGKNRVG